MYVTHVDTQIGGTGDELQATCDHPGLDNIVCLASHVESVPMRDCNFNKRFNNAIAHFHRYEQSEKASELSRGTQTDVTGAVAVPIDAVPAATCDADEAYEVLCAATAAAADSAAVTAQADRLQASMFMAGQLLSLEMAARNRLTCRLSMLTSNSSNWKFSLALKPNRYLTCFCSSCEWLTFFEEYCILRQAHLSGSLHC